MKKSYLICILIFIVVVITNCQGAIDYDVKYFSKRKWCSINNKYEYYKPIDNIQKLKDYYKISYFKGTDKISIEAEFADKNTPNGEWYYYNADNKLI
ncbi:MAG: hypothetical protein OEV44_13410, partial [Spirochaetota bacterium]|nr:hypothetical protein [Spirochaetota bacterium]